jgi:hypothetical protein
MGWVFSVTSQPLYCREAALVLGGHMGRSGWVRKNSPPPATALDPRIFQPVPSCYTDSAIPAHNLQYTGI